MINHRGTETQRPHREDPKLGHNQVRFSCSPVMFIMNQPQVGGGQFSPTQEDIMAISGYPSITSVEPGGTIDFHLSDDSSGPRTLLVERIGIPANAVSQSITANVRTQPRPANNPWEGFGWSATTSF